MDWLQNFNNNAKIFRKGFLGGLSLAFILLFGGGVPKIPSGYAILTMGAKAFFIAFMGGLGSVAAVAFGKWVKNTKFGKWIIRKVNRKPKPPAYGETFSNNGHSTNNKKAS